jgi:hypothetical protein
MYRSAAETIRHLRNFAFVQNFRWRKSTGPVSAGFRIDKSRDSVYLTRNPFQIGINELRGNGIHWWQASRDLVL